MPGIREETNIYFLLSHVGKVVLIMPILEIVCISHGDVHKALWMLRGCPTQGTCCDQEHL